MPPAGSRDLLGYSQSAGSRLPATRQSEQGLMLPSSLPTLYRPGLYRASSRPLPRAAHRATKEAEGEQS